MESKWISLTSLAVTGIALIVAIAVPFLQRETSELSVTVISKASLNPLVPDGFRPHVSLSINGRPVQFPHYSVVEIANSGSRPILAEAVEQPLKVKLQKGAIVSAEVISAKPDALKPSTRIQVDAIEIVPALLNPGDSFQLGVISAGADPSFMAEGRIAGLRSINVTEKSPSDAKPSTAMRYVLGVALVLISGMLSAVGIQGTFFRRDARRAVANPRAALVLAFFAAISSIYMVQEVLVSSMADYPRWLVFTLLVVSAASVQVVGQLVLTRFERSV